jgi:hypothetical protein
MPSVVHPNIDSLEMMHYEPDGAINLLPIPHVTGKRQSLVRMPDSRACGFEPAGIARKQHHLRTALCEQFCNRLPDAHRGSGNNGNFSRK